MVGEVRGGEAVGVEDYARLPTHEGWISSSKAWRRWGETQSPGEGEGPLSWGWWEVIRIYSPSEVLALGVIDEGKARRR